MIIGWQKNLQSLKGNDILYSTNRTNSGWLSAFEVSFNKRMSVAYIALFPRIWLRH